MSTAAHIQWETWIRRPDADVHCIRARTTQYHAVASCDHGIGANGRGVG